jgi:CMP-N-acetylneuraminic acid synthetase
VPAEHNPHWVYFKSDVGRLRLSTGEASPIPRRQDLPPAFHREGSVYLMRRDVLMIKNSLYGDSIIGYEIDPAISINIDTAADWDRAEILVGQIR